MKDIDKLMAELAPDAPRVDMIFFPEEQVADHAHR